MAFRRELFVCCVDVRLDSPQLRATLRVRSIYQIEKLARGDAVGPVRDDADNALPDRTADHQARWERSTTGGAAKTEIVHAERIVAAYGV